MKVNNDRDEFWQKLEQELGEKIEAYSLSRCVLRDAKNQGPFWGLCYITKSAFYFRHFAQENWLSSIIKVSGRTSKTSEEFIITVPLDSVVSFTPPPKRSVFSRLMGAEMPPIVIRYTKPDSTVEELHVSIDSGVERFVSLLSSKGSSGGNPV
jgi:phage FluMu gp28-like protein